MSTNWGDETPPLIMVAVVIEQPSALEIDDFYSPKPGTDII